MADYTKKWIDIGLKTGETDFETFDKYFPVCYEKAGLVYPKNVVRVKSPLVGALASAIAEAIWNKKRDAVGDAVGGAVGGAVGDAVRGAVGDGIKIMKKLGLSISWHYWLGGQFWVGGWYWGVAFVNFFFDVCKLKIAKDIMERAEAYRKVCESANYIWPNRDFVMVCERPTKINRDDRGRLHSETEKSIEYPDNWGLYYLHGVRFEKEWWEKIVGDQMTPDDIFAIDNIEHRRIAYEYMDKAKMNQLKDFKILDEQTDDKGKPMKIISFTVQNMREPLLFYNCIDASTDREYFVGTDKKTCIEAKNASFGLENVEWIDEF